MANYCEYSVYEQTDPQAIGVGIGEAKDGTNRICVAGLTPKDGRGLDWTALTPACARELFEQLQVVRHLFDDAT